MYPSHTPPVLSLKKGELHHTLIHPSECVILAHRYGPKYL